MKTTLLILLFFPSAIFAQRISVDSLENSGYHVRIYKPGLKPKMQTIIRKEQDTIYIPIVRILILRDTILREQVYYYHIEQAQLEAKPNLAEH